MDYTKAEAKQAARERFTGLCAAITTPFDDTGAVDYDALRRDLDRLTDDLQMDGIFCTGVMSEFWALTEAERWRLVEVVAGPDPGHVPGHRAHRPPLGGAGDRVHQACPEGRCGLRRADQPLLPAGLGRGPVPVVRAGLPERGHRGVAVRHRILRRVAVHRAHRAAGRHRERLRHQGRPGPCPLPGGAGPGRRPDPGLRAERGDLAGEHPRPRPARLHVLGGALPVPDPGLAADARVHRAGARRGLRRGR